MSSCFLPENCVVRRLPFCRLVKHTGDATVFSFSLWSNVDFSVSMGRIHGHASVFSLSMQESRFLWWDGTIRLIVSVIRVQIEA